MSFIKKLFEMLANLINLLFKKKDEVPSDEIPEKPDNPQTGADEDNSKDNTEEPAHDTDNSSSSNDEDEKNYYEYTVVAGDSWWGIAKKFLGDGSKCDELAAFNDKDTADIIHPGDVLKIPKTDDSPSDEDKTDDDSSKDEAILTRRDYTDGQIWEYLKSCGFNDFGTAGLMGNLYAESGLKSNNLQNNYEAKLGMNDEEYVAAVDSASYDNFVHDSAGFGLAQWTYWSRKQNLLNYAHLHNVSIADAPMQCEFLVKELKESYKSTYNCLTNAGSVKEASDAVLLKFERPADQSEKNCERRASYGMSFYNKFAK